MKIPGWLGAAALIGAWAPGLARGQAFDLPEIPRCTELVPAAISIEDRPVTLNLRVVLDGVAPEPAAAAVAAARRAYLPLGIDLSASYAWASFASSDGDALIEEAKRLYGGRAPGDVHAVYVITAKDLYFVNEVGEPDYTLVGLADCIGGAAHPENAFAIGENVPDDPVQVGVHRFGERLAGKTLGHELGHLVGGHHHYANCAEAAPEIDDMVCTLMINDLNLAALRFSTLNGIVVRGHAQLLPPLAPTEGAFAFGGGGAGGGGFGVLGLAVLLTGAAARREKRRANSAVSSC